MMTQMSIISVSIDTKNFKTKPTKSDITLISNRIAKKPQLLEISEFAQKVVLPFANTWTCGVYKDGKRNNKSWEKQNIFALDFDSGITFDEVMSRCKRYNILPSIAYTTFSSSEKLQKFRVIFTTLFTVKEERVRKLIQISLMTLFPECDKACKDAARLYFGGKNLLLNNSCNKINIVDLVDGVCAYIVEYNKKNGHESRKLDQYAKQIDVALLNDCPYVKRYNEITKTEKNSENENIAVFDSIDSKMSYFIVFGYSNYDKKSVKKEKSGNKINIEYIERNEGDYEMVEEFDFKELKNKCELYRKLANNEEWLYHNDLFGIATNLVHIKGGQKRFFEALENNSEYDVDKWQGFFSYIRKAKYFPQCCINFCSKCNNCEHAPNMIFQSKLQRGTINKLGVLVYKKLEDAEKQLNDIFETATSYEDNKIYCIKAPTGIGKTEHLLDIENALIAVPTHRLKDEIHKRATEKGILMTKTPELPKDIPELIRKNIEGFYRIGATERASQYITQIAIMTKNKSLLDYVQAQKRAFATPHSVVTTHHKLLFSKTINQSTIIIDEDIILTSLFKTDNVKISELMRLKKDMEYASDWCESEEKNLQVMNSLLKFIENCDNNMVCKMPSLIWDSVERVYADALNTNTESNVLGFLYCDYFIKNDDDITFIIKNELPRNKKIIITSATLNEEICKLAFGDRCIFIDLGEVEIKGKIEQYPKYSCSRYSIGNNDKALSFVKENIGDLPVITFKKYANLFENTIGTFGSVLGLDSLNGKDMAVVGTPHLNPMAYILFAKALGLNPKMMDTKMNFTKIIRNNFEFYFQTYSEDNDLKNVQLYMIESEIMQAIGRARLLSNDCTVKVFSNLPISQAEFKYK
jgi:hypothetical protein